MGFLDKIQELEDARSEAELAAKLKRKEEASEIKRQRAKIIDEMLMQFATSSGVECVKLPDRANGVQHFLIGEMVFAVRQFGHIEKAKLTSRLRTEVLWQHCIAIVGVDITQRPVEVGRATLATLSFDRIAGTVTNNCDYEFGCEAVIPVLYPNN